MRLKTLACCFWLLSCATLGLAQDARTLNDKIMMASRFGGPWVLDSSRSDFGIGSQGNGITGTLELTSTYFEFEVVRRIKFNGRERETSFLYYTDGRGETNQVVGESRAAEIIRSKTKWEGSKIVSKTSVNNAVLVGESVNFDVEETWELSTDGKSLTDIFTLSSPLGTQRFRYVYNRAH